MAVTACLSKQTQNNSSATTNKAFYKSRLLCLFITRQSKGSSHELPFLRNYISALSNRSSHSILRLCCFCDDYDLLFYSAQIVRASLKSDYYSLWELSGTNKQSVSNSITYGSTPTNNISPAVVFVPKKEKRFWKSYKFCSQPRCKSCTDFAENRLIISAELKGNSSSGHSMVASEYTTIVNKNDVTNFINTLTVRDGRSTDNRSLNQNANHYT